VNKKPKEPLKPEQILAKKRATIALQNMTNIKLQINNNKIVTFGPNKGQWTLYKELIIAPHQCMTTDLIEDENHQLMVYSNPDPDIFFYMIRDTDLYDKLTVQLYDDHFKFIDGLIC